MAKILIIGCGGVASVAIQKCAKKADVFSEICIASRTVSKCDALKEKLAGCLELRGMKEPMTVFNPVSFRRTERLEWEGRELTVTLEPFEILAADGASAEPEEVKARQEQAVRFG